MKKKPAKRKPRPKGQPKARIVVPAAVVEVVEDVKPTDPAVFVVVDDNEKPLMEIPVPPSAFRKLLSWLNGKA